MRVFSLFFLTLAFAAFHARAESEDILRLSFLGGQYFFEGQENSLAGNASVLYSRAMEISGRSSLLAIYDGSYRGTKEVTDLVGGGTLFQENMSHRVGGRWIWQMNERWAIKPMAGFKYELLKETKDETWFKGLFDYQKADAGVEVERLSEKKRSFAASYNFFPLWFPNYDSLESKTDLGRELAGRKILDTYNHLASMRWELPWFKDTVLSLGAMGLTRFYTDQRLIEETGNYSSALRRDVLAGAHVAGRRGFVLGGEKGLIISAQGDYSRFRSNQNHLDSAQSRFLSRYYDYSEYKAQIGSQLFLGPDPKTAKTLGVSFWGSLRRYDHRLIQDSGGRYQTENTHLDAAGFTLSAAAPVGQKGVFLRTAVQGAAQSSNMKYEANYRYNFSTFNYLLGFSYEF